MEISTCALLIIAGFSLFSYFKRKLKFFEDFGVPYIPGWPLLGNTAKTILRRQHITETIREIYNYNTDAKYIGAFNLTTPVIVLRDLELIKNVAIKNFDNFPNHQTVVDESIDPLFGGNLFSILGERWKEARSLLSPAFTSSKMKSMFELMAVCAQNVVNYLSERTEDENEIIGTKDLFTKYTNDVIATCAFGINIDSLKNPNNDFYTYGRKATNFDGIFSIKFFFGRAIPRLFKMLKITFVNHDVSTFFKNIISTTVATRDEQGINRPDMLQLMMNARGKDNKYLKLDITEMTAQAFIFFFGGFDTTSTQMCVIAHELTINPDIQKRLQDEIDDVLKATDGKPTYEAINSMPYLDAVFNESLRRHQQAPMLDRICTKALELPPALPGGKPFIVQPGMTIWIPAAAIHMDPLYYENPTKFDPDRYYQKKISINDVYNLGFGIGPRSCIANRFAVLETKILFFFLLSQFNLKSNSKTCNPFIYSKKSLATVPSGGYWLKIEKRH